MSEYRRNPLPRITAPASHRAVRKSMAPGFAWVSLLLSTFWAATAWAVVPPVPTQPAPQCDAVVGGRCYVDGPFTISASSPGAHHFRICRSEDVQGWGGCSTTISNNAGSSITVSGAHLPGNGSRRAYYFSACDSANACTAYGDNPEVYVEMDQTAPTAPGASTVACDWTNGSHCWVKGAFTVSVGPASDGASGVDSYEYCRSHDVNPDVWGGCQANITHDGGTSFQIAGGHLPADGKRRAYYVRARDHVGTWGPWNTPRFVRFDRHNPAVNASGASTTWVASATATVAAADVTNGASANSGLAEVRYRWNTPTNGTCTNGTVTSSGAALEAPLGENTLYLCARDRTGRVGTWSGTYRVDDGAPTAPGPTSVNCAWTTPGTSDCWVTGAFTASVAPATDPGGVIDGYNYCRSNDLPPGTWGGCAATITTDGGTSHTIGGGHLPADGKQRAIWVRARDGAGTYGPWNTPRFVRIDRYDPQVSASGASDGWFASASATIVAADIQGNAASNSGLAELRYRWGTPLNAACTNGTLTSSGATLSAPEGDNVLYLCARDNTGRVGTWNGRYRVDNEPPTFSGLTVSSDSWSIGDQSVYQITAKASDSGSGVREMKALINLKGSNAAHTRGNFSWRDQSLGYLWTGDQLPCTGGGFASKRPDAFNPNTVTLVGCSTSKVGNQRTVVFSVRPEASFGTFGPINDVAYWAMDFRGQQPPDWLNADTNFASGEGSRAILMVRADGGTALPENGDVLWGTVEHGAEGGSIAKNIVVSNAGESDARNLILEHHPSNIRIVGSDVFSIVGTLDSPLAVGQADGFDVRLDTTQAGSHNAQLWIYHSDDVRPIPLHIDLIATVEAPETPAPEVSSVDGAPVRRGQIKNITIHGANFQNAEVYVATRPAEGADPRVYPSATLQSVSSDGRRLTVRVDATASGVDGFYNLGIETPSGATAAQFRIVGPEPVIDMWTPSEPIRSRVHVLQVAGENLAGANVVPMHAGVRLLDVDNSDSKSLSGVLFVADNVPIGDLDIRIEGAGGITMLPLVIRPDESSATVATHLITTEGGSSQAQSPAPFGQSKGGGLQVNQSSNTGQLPRIYFQDPAFNHPALPDQTRKHLHDDEKRTSITRAEQLANKGHGVCFSLGARGRFNWSAVLLSLFDDAGDPLNQQVINALLPGGTLSFTSLTFAVSAFLEFDFSFTICSDGVGDARFCIRGGVAVLIPFVGGFSRTFDRCVGFNQEVELPPSGRIDSHTYTSDDNCVEAFDLVPGSLSGERDNELRLNCCQPATVSIRTSGVVFDRAFVSEGPVIDVQPNCVPPASGELRLFLDVDDDNNFSTTTAVPMADLDDLPKYVPGARLDGASVPDLSVTPQRMKLVAAYVDVQNGNVKVVPPPSGVSQVRISLSETSAFVGVAGNWPVSGGSTAPDFHLGSGGQQATVTLGGDHTARVDFVASDYGGFTTASVAPVGGGAAHECRIPMDDDGNMLPDAGWEESGGEMITSHNRAADNDADFVPIASAPLSPTNPANGRTGDGLSVYEEYRGFMARGAHIRTSPTVKDLFISSSLVGGAAYADPNLPLDVHQVWGHDDLQPTEYNPIRVINGNDANGGTGGPIPGHSEQKALRATAATTVGCLLGQALTLSGAPATPNETLVLHVFPASFTSMCGVAPAVAPNAMMRTLAHEVGHGLHLCHRGISPAPCSAAEVGPGLSAMNSGVFPGANGPNDPASQYDGFDQGQMRLHLKHP